MPDANWTAEQIEGILDEEKIVFVLQERDQPSKYLKMVEVRQRTADELGVFLEVDGIEENEDFIKCRDALASAVNWLEPENGVRTAPPAAVMEWLNARLLAATEIADKMVGI
jgi:hypothetical protein